MFVDRASLLHAIQNGTFTLPADGSAPLSLLDTLTASQTDPSVADVPSDPAAPLNGSPTPQVDPQSLQARALAALPQTGPQVDAAPIAPPSDSSATPANVVPQFQAAPDLVEHHGILSRALSAIGRGANVAAKAYGNALAPVDPTLAATLSPEQLHQIRSSALFNAGTSMLGNTTDAQGRGTSALERIGAGLAAGRAASQTATGGAIQANQFAAQQAAARDLATKRGQIQRLYAIQPGDSPDVVDKKVQALAASYAAIGDSQSLNALAQASSLFKQPKPIQPRSLEHVETIDPKTGRPAIGMIDAATGEVVKYLPAVAKPDPSARALTVEQQDKSIDRVTKTYDNETKDFQKARSGFEVLQGALANPNLYAPFAMLDAFARVVNPGAIVRPTTLELLKATGSGEDRIRRWASLLEKGQWPADLTGALNSTIGGIMQQHYTTAQAARKRALARLNTLNVSDPDTYLDDLNYGAAPSAPASISTPRPTSAAPTIAAPSNSTTVRGNY